MSSVSISRGDEFHSVGVLIRADAIYRAAFWEFIVLTLIPTSPILLIQLALGPSGGGPGMRGAVAFLQLIFWSLAITTCLYGAYQTMRHTSFSVAESLRLGLDRFDAVVGAAFFAGLLVCAGLLLFIVPGLLIWSILFVVLPACVIERLQASESFHRSRELTKGHRLQILWLVLLLVIAHGIVAVLAVVAGVAVGVGLASETIGWALALITNFVGQTVVQSFAAVLSAVVYHDLRFAKEGVDIDTMASVFE